MSFLLWGSRHCIAIFISSPPSSPDEDSVEEVEGVAEKAMSRMREATSMEVRPEASEMRRERSPSCVTKWETMKSRGVRVKRRRTQAGQC